MSDTDEYPSQSGIFSDAYSYETIDFNKGGPVSQAFGVLGSALTGVLASNQAMSTQVWAQATGEQAGKMLGAIIDDSDKILNNIETFFKELEDQRSWEKAISDFGGGSLNPFPSSSGPR